ncbi:DUF421 domain-containing protein [Shimazuella soli]|uniref:DUF421 domain-containing protein n=1 Tax=Shimazuella soli TaxID=1892854 RepID=UPI001F10A123|nr:DUF421 domain-containing protein [Shimazuella soli]
MMQLFWEVPIIFIALLLLTRLQGKKAISQLTYFDYITGIILGDIAAVPLVDEGVPVTRALLSLALFGGLSILASYLGTKFRNVRLLAEGEPVTIIKDGKILEKNIERIRLDLDNLRMLLRKKDVFSVADVEFAVMETDGCLSVLKKTAQGTPTRKDLGLKTKQEKPGIEIIIDGVFDEQKLKEAKLTKKDVQNILKQHKIKDIKEVSYMEITGDGKVYLDRYHDQLH